MLLGTSMTFEASSGLHGKSGSLRVPETQLVPSWRLQTKRFPTLGTDGLPCTVNQVAVHKGSAYALCYGGSINRYRQLAHSPALLRAPQLIRTHFTEHRFRDTITENFRLATESTGPSAGLL